MASEMYREAIRGHAGKEIRDACLGLIERLDKKALSVIRNGTDPYGEARYAVGVSDGVRLALNTIMDMAKDG